MQIWIDFFVERIDAIILPTVLLLVFDQIHLYKGAPLKEKIKGFLLDFLVSYMVLFTFQILVYQLVLYIALEITSINVFAYLAIGYSVYVVTTMLFAAFYVLIIKRRNKIPGLEEIVPTAGLFVYAQYMILVYISSILARDEFTYNIYLIIVTALWYLFFRWDFQKIFKIYSRSIISVENVCLICQVLVILSLWFAPETLSPDVFGEQLQDYDKWMAVAYGILYIFCLTSHKAIFHQLWHQYKEEINLTTDELTGLSSKKYFTVMGQNLIDKMEDKAVEYEVIFIDIAQFKYVNQNFGRQAGDDLLKNFAAALKENFPKAKLYARLSDDRFAVMVEESENLELALLKIRKQVSLDDQNKNIHLRAGMVKVIDNSVPMETVLDNAMTACKSTIPNNTVAIRRYDEVLKQEEEIRAYVLESIDKAVKDGALTVFYQPIVDINTGKVVCAEALSRWVDKKYGFISPQHFVPVLEAQNLAYKIDCFVADYICQKMRNVLDEGKPIIPIGFNVSRKDFFATDMVKYLEDTVKKYDIDRSKVRVEITESSLAEDDKYVAYQIERYRNLGYQVWMDDFGSGYSSLNLLGNYKFDGIKLDMEFLRDISDSKKTLMKGIINTTNEMGIGVLAEGVETSAQEKLLCDIGCNIAQGYKYCRPLPLDEFEKFISTRM